jgi:hypothetical protein
VPQAQIKIRVADVAVSAAPSQPVCWICFGRALCDAAGGIAAAGAAANQERTRQSMERRGESTNPAERAEKGGGEALKKKNVWPFNEP